MPKKLRFDLSISRRLSMDQVVEEEPREEEEISAAAPSSAPPARRPSLQRKGKRSLSLPEQRKSFSLEVPTPRKPCPRFNSQSLEDKTLRPTCDEDAGPTNPVATTYLPRSLTPAASSDPPSPTKYLSISEVKHSSKTTTREVCRTYSKRLVRTVSTRSHLKENTPPGGEELHSADNSLQGDSFHSVEDYESKEGSEEVKEADEEIPKEEDGERLKDDMERPKEEERPKEDERVREEQEPRDDQISHSGLVEPHGEKEDQGSAVPTKSDEPTDQPPLEELGGSEVDSESTYVIKFSDSEEEEEVAAMDDAGKAGSDSESTATESLSRADTVLCSDNPYFLSPVGNSSVNQTKSGGDPAGYFPSDLANIPPYQLITRVRETLLKMRDEDKGRGAEGGTEELGKRRASSPSSESNLTASSPPSEGPGAITPNGGSPGSSTFSSYRDRNQSPSLTDRRCIGGNSSLCSSGDAGETDSPSEGIASLSSPKEQGAAPRLHPTHRCDAHPAISSSPAQGRVSPGAQSPDMAAMTAAECFEKQNQSTLKKANVVCKPGAGGGSSDAQIRCSRSTAVDLLRIEPDVLPLTVIFY